MQFGLKDILDIVIGSAMLLIFLRFMLDFAGIDGTNPFAKIINRLTGIVDIFGRIFPTVGGTPPPRHTSGLRLIEPKGQGINTAALMLMFLLRMIYLSGIMAIKGQHFAPLHLFFVGGVSLILDFLQMCQFVLTASVIASLVMMFTQSENPIWSLIMQLSEPIIAPFRKIVPNMGMLDLGFMAAYVSLLLAEIFVNTIAKNLLQR